MAEGKDILDFDELQMYFGEDYVVNDYITIHTPTVGEIIKLGERKYYSVVSTITAIPSDMKSILFDMHIDYEKISDFQLFYLITRNIHPEDTELLFGNLDLSKMNLYFDDITQQAKMVNPNSGEIIDELAYFKIVGYLRKLHGFSPKIEHAANKTTKDILIRLDRQRHEKNKNKKYQSQLKPLVSSMMRYPGFKYKSSELRECSIYEFMDTVRGAQIYVASTALLKGAYSGMIDTSKINKKDFDWMRSPE